MSATRFYKQIGTTLALVAVTLMIGGCRFGFEGLDGQEGAASDAGGAADGASVLDAASAPDATSPLIEDSSLVVRYFLNEADSGQAPVEAYDSAADPLTLPLLYDTGSDEMRYCADGPNRGLCWNAVRGDSAGIIPVVGTKIQSRLNGGTAATVEVVVNIDDAHFWGSRILHIGQGGSQWGLSLIMHDNQSLSFRFDDKKFEAWELTLSGGRHVIHAVADTTERDQSNRMAVYVDGTRRPLYTGTCLDNAPCELPVLNEQVNISNDMNFTIGNSPSLTRSPQGAVYYAAVYDRALTSDEILSQTAKLMFSDDAP